MRPIPPSGLLEFAAEPLFLPAPEVIDWATRQFIESGAELYNEDHT